MTRAHYLCFACRQEFWLHIDFQNHNCKVRNDD